MILQLRGLVCQTAVINAFLRSETKWYLHPLNALFGVLYAQNSFAARLCRGPSEGACSSPPDPVAVWENLSPLLSASVSFLAHSGHSGQKLYASFAVFCAVCSITLSFGVLYAVCSTALSFASSFIGLLFHFSLVCRGTTLGDFCIGFPCATNSAIMLKKILYATLLISRAVPWKRQPRGRKIKMQLAIALVYWMLD